MSTHRRPVLSSHYHWLPHSHLLTQQSDLRQVPDTQEVFLDKDSDTSIIVEILQRVQPEDDEPAAKLG